MIRAYDKSYLATAQKNLARMLDYLVNNLHYPLETAWQWFVTSEPLVIGKGPACPVFRAAVVGIRGFLHGHGFARLL